MLTHVKVLRIVPGSGKHKALTIIIIIIVEKFLDFTVKLKYKIIFCKVMWFHIWSTRLGCF